MRRLTPIALTLVLGLAVASCGTDSTAAPVTRATEKPAVTTTTQLPTTTTTEAPATSTSTSTSTTVAPTTTTPPAPSTTVPPPVEPEVLEAGVSGPRTQALQQRLHDLGYDPGPVDGQFGSKTTMAVWAWQKLHEQEPTGKVHAAEWEQIMMDANDFAPLVPAGAPDRTEIDLAKQVMVVWKAGRPTLVTHVSTGSGKRYNEPGGSGVAVTPTGDYAYTRQIEGWRQAPLGGLYKPVYFNGGIAVHGATSVPLRPASHGCVRIPMHIAEYFQDVVWLGMPVHVR